MISVTPGMEALLAMLRDMAILVAVKEEHVAALTQQNAALQAQIASLTPKADAAS